MEKYTGTKTIKARPMTRGNYNKYRGLEIPKDENPSDKGYLVGYSDSKGNFDGKFEGGCNYISWSPSDVFEVAYKNVGSAIGTYQERVVCEKKELDEKLEKLCPFIDSDIFNKLEEGDKTLLIEQQAVMSSYSNILANRIDRFK